MIRRRIHHCWLVALLAAWMLPHAAVANDALPEYKVKAAIVFKVAKFVSWPNSAFESSQSPIVMCVAGKDPFGQYIDNLDGEAIQGRSLVVRRLQDDVTSLDRCHMVFLAQTVNADDVLLAIGSKPILTIGDSEEFAVAGGMLGLRLENNRVAFEINLDATRQSDLKVSASLLQLATIVKGSVR